MKSTSTSSALVWDAGSFVGGALCLDFANTQGGRDKMRDLERLTTYEDAVSWASAASMITTDERDFLTSMALKAPAEAARTLEQLQRFRECLYRLFSAQAGGREIDPRDEECLRRAVAAAISIAHLRREGDLRAWTIDAAAAGLNTLLGRIALAAQQLALGSELPYVRECARCSWLFVDRTKNKRRRWCKTETCGNRTRAARHYRLSKSSGRRKDYGLRMATDKERVACPNDPLGYPNRHSPARQKEPSRLRARRNRR